MARAGEAPRLPRRELSFMARRVASLYALLGPVHWLGEGGEGLESRLAAAILALRVAEATLPALIRLYQLVSMEARRVARLESRSALGYLDVASTAYRLAVRGDPVWLVVERKPDPSLAADICNVYARVSRSTRAALGSLEPLLEGEGLYGAFALLARRLARRVEALLVRVSSLYSRLCSETPRASRRPRFSPGTSRLYERLERLSQVLGELAGGTVHVEYGRGGGVDVGRVWLLYAQRLYELYVLLVTLEALDTLVEKKLVEKSVVQVNLDGSVAIVVYNRVPKWGGKPLSRVALGEVEPASGIDSSRVAGRPDITILDGEGRVAAVIEAKYSRSPVYLTAARFKVLAYIHEYNAKLGVLAYPGPPRGEPLEPEDEGTTSLLKEATRHNGVTIRVKNDAALRLQPIEPSPRGEERAVEALSTLLRETLAE